ncbi:MAG: lysine--tRNA ligase [Firmicutes bacterium]|nr:lysine--tRNA ligase [Bacillota bacterium]
MAEEQVLDLTEQFLIRKDKLEKLQAEGKNPYSITKFDQDAYSADLQKEFAELPAETDSGKKAALAGRIMTKRIMGKASFAHLRDDKGDIQIYVRRDELGDEEYAAFKKLDIGDIIGVKGEVFRTKTGELSVRAEELTLLSKGLRPLPDKFHGLTDTELRYRQRYVDLIMDPSVKETFIKRTKIMNGIRSFMNGRGYLEVETPILTPFEIGAAARPFTTHHNTLDMDMVLRIETELYLKRLIVGGIDRVYEIGRIFRNEGMDPRHNPEFTSIELYQAYADFHDMMDLVEDLFKQLADDVCGTRKIVYGDKEIDFDNWSRLTMKDAVKKYSGVDFDDWKSDEDAIACAKAHNVELPEVPTRGSILAEFFDAYVEDKLVQPTFIYDYPVEISPLAKRKPDDPEFTERFEFFINCMEFGNAFSELNDPIDQRGRFERQVAERKALEPDCKAQVDYDFINALEYGMPPTGGLGIGVDRLVMLLTNSQSIRDVLLFPTMRPEGVSAKKEPVKIDRAKVKIEPLFEEFVDFETFSRCDFRAVKVKSCEAVKKSEKLLKFVLDDGTGEDRVILSGIHKFYEPEELVGKTLVAILNLPPRKMMGETSNGMLISCANEYDGEEMLNLIIVDSNIPAGAKLC